MRDLVVHAWTSADGFSADEGTEVMQRMGEIDDPAFDELFAGRLASAGTHIMGRVTYLEMAEFWPKSSHVTAAPMNDIPKVVFSRTLRDASWPETRIASGDTVQVALAWLLARSPRGKLRCRGPHPHARPGRLAQRRGLRLHALRAPDQNPAPESRHTHAPSDDHGQFRCLCQLVT
jgi:dihydrofolate reductase